MLTRLTQKLKIVLHQMISLPNQPTKEEENKNNINKALHKWKRRNE